MTPSALRPGDALALLGETASDSVDCVVTSPSYYGLRQYAGEWQQYVLWSDRPLDECFPPPKSRRKQQIGHRHFRLQYRAWQKGYLSSGQGAEGFYALGLEPHPSLFLEHLWAIMDEVRRGLKPTGCAFVVIGDSYCSLKGSCYNPGGGASSLGQERKAAGAHPLNRGNKGDVPEADRNWLRPKQLLLLPSRFAIGCQERGWIVRNDIPWIKSNAMPDSATDRFTTSWEHVFYMTKQERVFFNMEEALEPSVTGAWEAMPPIGGIKQTEGNDNPTYSGNRPASNGLRHPRDVFFIPTEPSPLPHYAVMPSALARRCIRAGCPVKVCAECGRPWEREVEVEGNYHDAPGRVEIATASEEGVIRNDIAAHAGRIGDARPRTPGPWHPACKCATEEWEAGLVLDPFAGSGTTLKVAVEEGRRALGFEISEAYCKMARRRVGAAQRPLEVT